MSCIVAVGRSTHTIRLCAKKILLKLVPLCHTYIFCINIIRYQMKNWYNVVGKTIANNKMLVNWCVDASLHWSVEHVHPYALCVDRFSILIVSLEKHFPVDSIKLRLHSRCTIRCPFIIPVTVLHTGISPSINYSILVEWEPYHWVVLED